MASRFFWTLAVLAAISYPAAANLGQQVAITVRPSIVQIEVRVATAWIQQCVGSVLTSVHCLTSARCASGPLYAPENRRVRAGSSTQGSGGWLVQFNYAINHPNFGHRGFDSDISVVRLAAALVLGATVQQAPILSQGTILPVGLPVQVYGWGNTAQGGHSSDTNLYRLSLFLKATDSCAAAYTAENPVTENMLCAGLGFIGRDFDARDIGAPLMYEGIIVGVCSFGTNSNDVTPVVATSVASFTNWIIASAV